MYTQNSPFQRTLRGAKNDLYSTCITATAGSLGEHDQLYVRFNGLIELHMLYHNARMFVNSARTFLCTLSF